MKACPVVLCVLSLLIVLWIASPSPAGNAAALKAGAAKIDITPDKPVNMSGYAARKGLSTGVHDPLSARAVAFEVGGKRLVLISTDIIGYYEDVANYMRNALMAEFNLQPSELFLCAIHTHSAPTPTLSRERAHANNVEYTEGLKPKLIEITRKALANMEPVKLGVGVGSCPVGANRRELRVTNSGESSIVLGRNPYGTTDKEVLVMKVAKADGAPLAVMFDYATHGTSLGTANLTISGDVPGLAEQFVEKILGADVVAPIFVGASGNIDPWFRVLPKINEEPGWIPEPVLLGTFLG
jgi:neutral ceramidase